MEPGVCTGPRQGRCELPGTKRGSGVVWSVRLEGPCMKLVFLPRMLSVLCREVTQSNLSLRSAAPEEVIGAGKAAGRVGGARAGEVAGDAE